MNITPRERQVLSMMGDGLTNNQIAEALGIAVKAVERTLGTANKKLGTKNRMDAARAMKAMLKHRQNPSSSLRDQIIESLKGQRNPRVITWITSCCNTRHESRVGPLVRQLVKDGILTEHNVGVNPSPGYMLKGEG